MHPSGNIAVTDLHFNQRLRSRYRMQKNMSARMPGLIFNRNAALCVVLRHVIHRPILLSLYSKSAHFLRNWAQVNPEALAMQKAVKIFTHNYLLPTEASTTPIHVPSVEGNASVRSAGIRSDRRGPQSPLPIRIHAGTQAFDSDSSATRPAMPIVIQPIKTAGNPLLMKAQFPGRASQRIPAQANDTVPGVHPSNSGHLGNLNTRSLIKPDAAKEIPGAHDYFAAKADLALMAYRKRARHPVDPNAISEELTHVIGNPRINPISAGGNIIREDGQSCIYRNPPLDKELESLRKEVAATRRVLEENDRRLPAPASSSLTERAQMRTLTDELYRSIERRITVDRERRGLY